MIDRGRPRHFRVPLPGFAILAGCFSWVLAAVDGDEFPENDISDIIIEEPPPNLTPFVLGGIGVIALGIGVYYALKKYLGGRSQPPGPPAEVVARKRLKQIEIEMDESSPNHVSIETSNVVKDLLSTRFGDPIRYETAEEYLGRISRNEPGEGISPTLIELVRNFMSIGQELKFAQLNEARVRLPDLIDQAKKIVELAASANTGDPSPKKKAVRR